MSVYPKPGVVIFAKDVINMTNFYSEMFAFTIKHNDIDKSVLESDTFMLVIHGIPGQIAEKITIATPPLIREDVPTKLFLPVPSISGARVIAERLGGAIKPERFEWAAANFRACDGFDPEGNVIQIRESAP